MKKFLKHKSLFVDLAIIALVVIAFALYAHWHNQPKLKTANRTYKLLVAKTSAEQSKGLGGLPSLPTDEAMIFEFNNEAQRCFWMKNMHFPLDFVWANSKGQVVAIKKDVSPDYKGTFCSAQPAQYVFELNAGQVQAYGIAYGQTLSF